MDTLNRVNPDAPEVADAEGSVERGDTLPNEYSIAVGNRVRECRGTLSRAKFGQLLGIHWNTVGKLERGETLPDAAQLITMATFGGKSVEWLVLGESSGKAPTAMPIDKATFAVPDGGFIYVPHFDIKASAGASDPFNDVESVRAMRPFDQEFIRGELAIPHDEMALLSIVGSSMEPLFHSGDTVLVDLKAGYEMFTDGIHVIRLDEGLLVKQVQRLPGRAFRIKSLNPEYEPFDIKANEEADRDFMIIGKVVWGGLTIK